MLINMLRKDFLRNKSLFAALFAFVALAALLVASGSNVLVDLTHSMKGLFAKSATPHFVQMHAGPVDGEAVERWSAGQPLVEAHQTSEMILVDGGGIRLNRDQSEAASVMDHYVVKQNGLFDYLLDLDNEIIRVGEGEIAVPLYHMQERDLIVGDQVTIAYGDDERSFTISAFVRDAQMNPSIIHSKRFVVNEADWSALSGGAGELESLISFRLHDAGRLNEFRQAFESSELPQQGPNIDYPLFQVLNAITDGILAVVLIGASVLLMIIALLCLRFTLLAAMEEDYREIGILKAIGIAQRQIKWLYLAKYGALAAVAALAGYVASLFLQPLFTANIALYAGTSQKSVWLHLIPVASVLLLYGIVILACRLTLRAFNKISAVEALRSGSRGEMRMKPSRLALHKRTRVSVPFFLGIRDVLGRVRTYGVLATVFLLCTFLVIVPVNFLNTIESPSFNTYMGIEKSDLRIDLPYSEGVAEQFREAVAALRDDPDVARFAPIYISRVKMLGNEGETENLTVETGNFALFPLPYMTGEAPVQEGEIALSYLNAQELDKSVRDTVRLVVDGEVRELNVSGIYQDVTNGGRTAKALLPYRPEDVLRYEISVDLQEHVQAADKMETYQQAFAPARVTDLEGYLAQTLGQTITQLRLLTVSTAGIALLVSVLITALFMKLAVAKDHTQIAIMKSLGFSLSEIRTQYVTRSLFVLGAAIAIGTLLSNTAGEALVGAVMSFMGAPQIQFEVDAVQAYVLSPLGFLLAVTVTTILSLATLKRANIAAMNAK